MVKLAVLVLTGVMALGPGTPAAAGPVLESANRLALQAARQAAAPRAAATGTTAQGTLAESGMSKRRKFFIAAVALIGVAAGMYAIDHGVEDNTPSSRGTRKD